MWCREPNLGWLHARQEPYLQFYLSSQISTFDEKCPIPEAEAPPVPIQFPTLSAFWPDFLHTPLLLSSLLSKFIVYSFPF